MDENWMVLLQQNQLEKVVETNRITEKYGLRLSKEEARLILAERQNALKEQFETVCFGDVEYLEGTCLDLFAQAIRAGYGEYKSSQGYGEYAKFDIVKRWDHELYMEALRELCWR